MKLYNYPKNMLEEYYPRQAVWELTLKCNMNCLHCGSKAGKSRERELTLDECMDIAQQLIDMGLKLITLIGGEIFYKKDWEKIARKFVDNGVYTNIITNGYNLGDEQYRQIKESGIKQVGISFDGMEQSHNKIRRNNNSFEHVVNAFKRLKEQGYSTEAVTTLLDLNIGDLEEMYNFLVDNKVNIWQLQLASPMGNAEGKMNLLIDPAKVVYITNFIKEKNDKGKICIVAGDNVGYFDENEEYIRGNNKNGFLGCLAGKYVVGIDSVGNVKGCESLYSDDFIEGNLRENSLKEIWTRPGAFAYNRNFDVTMLDGKCRTCDKNYICAGGCRQLANFTTGNCYKSIYCCYPNAKD